MGTGASAVANSRRPARGGLGYRPHLDGLRTVAVYLVVAFHAGLGAFDGGFIGVDVFFVLSGFLVTRILLRDLDRFGRVQRMRFYARRVRRILPAAVVTLVVSALAYAAVAAPSEVLDVLGGFRAAFLYVANWYFVRQSTNYFAPTVDASPVLQFWSLAVEEQFYLVWPLLLGAICVAARRVGRARWWTVRVTVVALCLASAIAALLVARTNLPRAYYGTDTRAYQLLAGAALALTPQVLGLARRWDRAMRALAAISLAVVVALGTSLLSVGAVTRGVLVTGAALVLLTALENARGGVARRVLSLPSMTYLGKISYGTYLWHWPLIVIAAQQWDLDAPQRLVLGGLGATMLAALSFRLLESPIRFARVLDQYRAPVIATGLAVSIVLGLAVVPVILDRHSGEIASANGGQAARSGLRLLDWRVAREDFPDLPSCRRRAVSACTLVHGPGRRVVLMGDSDAWMWIPTFTEIAKRRGWTLSALVRPTCPWQRHLQVLFPSRFECRAFQEDWYERVLPALDPDLVVVAHQSFEDPVHALPVVGPGGVTKRPGDRGFEGLLESTTGSALRSLVQTAGQVLVIEPIPNAPADHDPLECLSTGSPARECTYRASRGPTALERFYRREALRPGIDVLNADRLVCPRFPVCDAVVDGIIVKRDINHLTATFARSLAPAIAARSPG